MANLNIRNLSEGERQALRIKASSHNKSMEGFVRDLILKSLNKWSVILESFMISDEFKSGVIASTCASWGGSDYKVELLPDGKWRVLWSKEIGNLYQSPGIILGLPTFTDDGTYEECVNGDDPISEEEYFDLCFANDEEDLKQELRNKLAGVA